MASDDDDNMNLQIALKKRRQQWPKWLNSVLGEPFFTLCEDHKDCRKNEKNIYCLDCDARICQNCLVCLDSSKYSHLQHNLLRIRRYVYQDVIRIQDLHKFMDCTKIQVTYYICTQLLTCKYILFYFILLIAVFHCQCCQGYLVESKEEEQNYWL